MNQRNSTKLSSSFQHEIRPERVAGNSFKKIRYRQNCFLIISILMVKKYMHENLRHTVKKNFSKKNKKVFTLSDCYDQQLQTLQISYTDTFIELFPNNTTHFSRHQTILTFSESYW